MSSSDEEKEELPDWGTLKYNIDWPDKDTTDRLAGQGVEQFISSLEIMPHNQKVSLAGAGLGDLSSSETA